MVRKALSEFSGTKIRRPALRTGIRPSAISRSTKNLEIPRCVAASFTDTASRFSIICVILPPCHVLASVFSCREILRIAYGILEIAISEFGVDLHITSASRRIHTGGQFISDLISDSLRADQRASPSANLVKERRSQGRCLGERCELPLPRPDGFTIALND